MFRWLSVVVSCFIAFATGCNLTNFTVNVLSGEDLQCQTNVTEIQFRGNLSNVTSDLLQNFTGVIKLDLANNSRLDFADMNPFLKSDSLTNLQMPFCNVSRIYGESFEGILKVKIINLANNRIATIDYASFDKNRDLEELYLNNNYLKTLSSELFIINTKLKLLNFTGNHNLTFSQGFVKKSLMGKLYCDDCFPNEAIFANQNDLQLLSLRNWNISNPMANQIMSFSRVSKVEMICVNRAFFFKYNKIIGKLSDTCTKVVITTPATTQRTTESSTETPYTSSTSTTPKSPTTTTDSPEESEIITKRTFFILEIIIACSIPILALISIKVLWTVKTRAENSFHPGYPYESSILNDSDLYDIY